MSFATVLNSSSQLHLPIIRRLPHRSSFRCSSSSTTTSVKFDLKTYWSNLVGEINRNLDDAIQVHYPDLIYQAMRCYSVLAKGAKRAPPVMCVAACELFGGSRAAAFPNACALEMEMNEIMAGLQPYLFGRKEKVDRGAQLMQILRAEALRPNVAPVKPRMGCNPEVDILVRSRYRGGDKTVIAFH